MKYLRIFRGVRNYVIELLGIISPTIWRWLLRYLRIFRGVRNYGIELLGIISPTILIFRCVSSGMFN